MHLLSIFVLAFLYPAFAYKTIIDVLSEDARFGRLIESLQRNRLVPDVNNLEAGTLFAPDNDAFQQYEGEVTREMLLYHLLPVGMVGQDFSHGQILESLYVRDGMLGKDHPGQRIKVTKDGNLGKGRGKAYINGAEIIDKDLYVNNQTYIQVINKVLVPPQTLGDALLNNEELHGLLDKTGVTKVLNEARPFTMFVSRQSVLNPFNPVEKAYMTSDYGKKDLATFLKYMILEEANYASDFPSGKTTFKTLNGETIAISVDKNNAITVNGVPVTSTDILAANGVIHELDDAFAPGSLVFTSRKYLYGVNATKFVSLLDDYGLDHYMDDNDNNQKYTFLAPGNEDINEDMIPNIYKRNWLSYHILTGSMPPDQLVDGSLLRTEFLSNDLAGAPQRVPVLVEAEGVHTMGRSIRFSHSRVLQDPVSVQGNTIYEISEPLSLPGSFLSKLVVDLEMSTFIATLYVSGVAEEVKHSSGITMFAPSNDAFHNLGLVAQFLMHSSGKHQLQNVLRYHVIRGLLYAEDIREYAHEVPTLADATIRVGPGSKDNELVVSRPFPSAEEAVISETDLLVSNGVVHKLNKVQVPDYVRITARDLMVGVEAKTMMEVLEQTKLMSTLNKTDYVVLVPTDAAFARIDLDALLQDKDALERLAKLHLVPMAWKNEWTMSSNKDSEYPSLLSDVDKVIFREEGDGDMIIRVKDQSGGVPARVRGMGRTYDSTNGGVLLIDAVLIPVHRGFFGLPFGWSIFLVVVLSLIIGSIAGGCGFIGYKIYTRRRLGYTSIST